MHNNGCSTENASHPVGTTVKLTNFFNYLPVRKQTAMKTPSRCLGKIRRLMQAYALARPTTRFRLRIPKAKNGNSDFVYAPKANANVEDAALKVVGKDCALQCDWTMMEADGFKIHASLPKPTADGSKISGQGAFISVDGRPLSGIRGTIKQIVTAFKERLRKSNPSLASVRDPFCCINIICPPESYDPNIEPAKDDVMFENSGVVLAVVDRILMSYYHEAVGNVNDEELPVSVLHHFDPPPEILQASDDTSVAVEEHGIPSLDGRSVFRTQPAQSQWRSTMYGIDEDDMEFLQDIQAPVVEEEKGTRTVDMSNPWTIARMNAVIKPKPVADNRQLLSPAKSQSGATAHCSSPNPSVTPTRSSSARPLTPQMSSRPNMARSLLDEELERSIQRLSRSASNVGAFNDAREEILVERRRDAPGVSSPGIQIPTHVVSSVFQPANLLFPQSSPVLQPPKPIGRRKCTKNFGRPLQVPSNPHGPGLGQLGQAKRVVGTQIYPEETYDIRNFFGQDRQARRKEYTHNPSFTPINPQTPSNQKRDDTSLKPRNTNRFSPPNSPTTQSSSPNREWHPSRTALRKSDQGAIPHRNSAHDNQTTAKEVEAYFLSHEQQQPYQTQTRKHKHSTAEGTKSFKPPVVPTHSILVDFRSNLHSIIRSTRKLDMTSNMSEWKHSAKDAYRVFSGPGSPSETVVMQWVLRLDAILEQIYGRVDGVDTRAVLYEGVWRGLGDDGNGRAGEERGCESRSGSSVVSSAIGTEALLAMYSEEVGARAEVWISGNGDMVFEGAERQNSEQGGCVADDDDDDEISGEYDDSGVEDEMLMEL